MQRAQYEEQLGVIAVLIIWPALSPTFSSLVGGTADRRFVYHAIQELLRLLHAFCQSRGGTGIVHNKLKTTNMT